MAGLWRGILSVLYNALSRTTAHFPSSLQPHLRYIWASPNPRSLDHGAKISNFVKSSLIEPFSISLWNSSYGCCLCIEHCVSIGYCVYWVDFRFLLINLSLFDNEQLPLVSSLDFGEINLKAGLLIRLKPIFCVHNYSIGTLTVRNVFCFKLYQFPMWILIFSYCKQWSENKLIDWNYNYGNY